MTNSKNSCLIKFENLVVGDSVYLLLHNSVQVWEAKVKKIERGWNDNLEIKLAAPFWFSLHVKPGATKLGKRAFTTKEEADEILKKRILVEYVGLEKEVDYLVTEFHALSRFLEAEEPKVKGEVRKFDKVRVGMGVWWLNKSKLKVERVRVLEVGEERKAAPGYRTLRIKTSREIFTAYPGSDYSFSREYHTHHDKALLCLIRYAKGRVKTVGDKMEKKMIQFEFLERVLHGQEIRRP